MMNPDFYKELLQGSLLKEDISKRAWDKAWEIGLPTKKTESFKKHNLDSIYANLVVQQVKEPLMNLKSEIAEEENDSALTLRDEIPEGVQFLTMEEAKRSYGVFLSNRLSKLIKSAKNIFPMLNEACCNEGKFFYVSKRVEAPVWLDDIIYANRSISMRRVVIYVAKGASCDFILHRKMLGRANANSLIDVVVEDGATCQMIELDVEGSCDACSMSHVRAQVKRDGLFRHFSASKGGALSRSDFHVELVGEGSEVDLQGVWNLDEKRRSHTDITIEHKAPNTKSNQHYKGVLRDKSQSTFEGKIIVDPIAQKTLAYQLNNNLILDNGASAFSKPNLEIFADDVKASHGATVTQLNEEELFYLQARGINSQKAKELLTYGFTKAILNRFFNDDARRIANGI